MSGAMLRRRKAVERRGTRAARDGAGLQGAFHVGPRGVLDEDRPHADLEAPSRRATSPRGRSAPGGVRRAGAGAVGWGREPSAFGHRPYPPQRFVDTPVRVPDNARGRKSGFCFIFGGSAEGNMALEDDLKARTSALISQQMANWVVEIQRAIQGHQASLVRALDDLGETVARYDEKVDEQAIGAAMRRGPRAAASARGRGRLLGPQGLDRGHREGREPLRGPHPPRGRGDEERRPRRDVHRQEQRGGGLVRARLRPPRGVKALTVPLTADTVFRVSTRRGTPRAGTSAHSPGTAQALARLGGDPQGILAVPLILRDKVAAVLYCDTPQDELPPSAADVIEILVAFAGKVIDVLSAGRDRPGGSRRRPPEAAEPRLPPARGRRRPRPRAPAPAGCPWAPGRCGRSPRPPSSSRPPHRRGPRPLPTPASGAARPALAPPARAIAPEDQKAHDDAKRFARLVVSEIKLYNEAKVTEGRKTRDIYERLKEDIERGRQMYHDRVSRRCATRPTTSRTSWCASSPGATPPPSARCRRGRLLLASLAVALLLAAPGAAGTARWRLRRRAARHRRVRPARGGSPRRTRPRLEALARRLAAVPGTAASGLAHLLAGLRLLDERRPADAVPHLAHADVQLTLVRDHALARPRAAPRRRSARRTPRRGPTSAPAPGPRGPLVCAALPDGGGRSSRARRQPEAAIPALEQVAASCPREAPEALLGLGEAHLARGDRAAAAAAFDRLDRSTRRPRGRARRAPGWSRSPRSGPSARRASAPLSSSSAAARSSPPAARRRRSRPCGPSRSRASPRPRPTSRACASAARSSPAAG